jgi:hypothetical protein
MTTIEEQATAYDESRVRIDKLTRTLAAEQLAVTVPCCPAWSVQDLVGHVTGALEDRCAARMPSGGFEEWTAEQVARHRGERVGDTLDRWASLPVEHTTDPPSLAALSFDAVSHEHDLYHALGVTGDRDTFAVRVGSARAVERMGAMLTGAGAPGVRLTTEDGEQLVDGEGTPLALTTTRFDVMRLVTGRVSRSQAEAMAWDGEPAPVLDALFADGFFRLQPRDVLFV